MATVRRLRVAIVALTDPSFFLLRMPVSAVET